MLSFKLGKRGKAVAKSTDSIQTERNQDIYAGTAEI